MADPLTLSLTLSPRSRYDAIDVAGLLANDHGAPIEVFPKVAYCSLHTTAGYIGQGLAARLRHTRDRLDPYIRAFQRIFPQGADYVHDQVELRSELTDEQRESEPRNGDSHLTFIGAGLRNMVTYTNHGSRPVYFIDLDGVNGTDVRTRCTTAIAYHDEEAVCKFTLEVPVSRHPVDSVNLNDPAFGLTEEIGRRLKAYGIARGRVEIALHRSEEHAGVTVNEYETLLMRNDLAQVVRDPLRYAASSGRRMLRDPAALPQKSLGYAKYDLVHVFNELMEAFRVQESVIEKVLSRFIAVPARRFLRMKRSVSLLVTETGDGSGVVLRGRYQSPILVQWRPAHRGRRRISVTLKRFF